MRASYLHAYNKFPVSFSVILLGAIWSALSGMCMALSVAYASQYTSMPNYLSNAEPSTKAEHVTEAEPSAHAESPGNAEPSATAEVSTAPPTKAQPSTKPAAVSLLLSGAQGMTDRSPAELTVVVGNQSAQIETIRVYVDAGHHDAWIATTESALSDRRHKKTVQFSVAPHSAHLAYIQVKATDPVRRGKAAVVVRAHLMGAEVVGNPGPPEQIATRELAVDLAGSDLLAGTLAGGGAAAAILLPGIFAVAAWLQVWVWERRKLELATRNAAQTIWEEKWLLLVAVIVSFIAAWFYEVASDRDLLDAYTLLDLLWVTITAAAGSAALSALALGCYRLYRPRITGGSPPRKVLRAANRYDRRVTCEVYLDSEGHQGLLVHRELGGVFVLTPPIRFSTPGSLWRANREANFNLGMAVEAVDNASAKDPFDGSYATTRDDPWIMEPIAIERPQPAPQQPPVKIISYAESDTAQAGK
ncbi:hypothetical protein ACIP6X_36830 [Streptomyces coeruleorubidus]|uniref:hypothetical protein n=1 Tax=Streptomyces coeruleorubidus TaxID=116188 RepID=UPI00380DB24B